MNDETQQRAVTILSSVITALLTKQLADRFIDVPDERGVADDIKEAALKAGFSLASTIIASMVVRRIVAGRWGG